MPKFNVGDQVTIQGYRAKVVQIHNSTQQIEVEFHDEKGDLKIILLNYLGKEIFGPRDKRQTAVKVK